MLGRNIAFPILNEDGTSFNGLVLHKATVDSVVMSLGDKITGDVYYKDNTLRVTMHEYIEYKQNVDDENEEPVKYILVSPPTIVREGMASDNSELRGMTKYSFEFYHPMCQLSNMPFTDIAVTSNEEKYLSQNKNFSWIGYPSDYIAKLNKNLQWSEWVVVKNTRFPSDKETTLSGVLTFSDNTIADALKTAYDTWGVPYVISQIKSGEQYYSDGKRFMITFGLPTNEIYESENDRNNNNPYIFKMGKGVGLKNNSRTPRKNKIVTRIAGYGSEDNIPYGYPQIVWSGNQDWDYTIDNDSTNPNSYPIYKGIVNGAYVKLIKHPFTRTHLMPSVYAETVNKKVNPNATGYDPTIEIKDYYDAIGDDYPNPINTLAPSYDIHEFDDIKPELGQEAITGAQPINDDRTIATDWDDSINDNGEYVQGYFQVTLPILDFDIYACAAITQQMQINMRSGACIGCTFTVQVDWEDYRNNFYTQDGNFEPQGEQRDYTKYPDSSSTSVTLILQKDTQTFGTLMPNIYQKPKSGDEFVILGISMPLSYITNAETRLDNAMLSYMLENNIHYYDYPLKFDEYFLATHTNILEQIHPNSIIHFQYGNETLELFVKQLTIKYGQGVLPQYDITLTDNVDVVLNQIGQVADSVEHLSTLISILRQGYNQNFFFELAKKLSKTGDDTASGLITFLRGLTSQGQANFLGGAQFGSSGSWTINNDGDANLNEIIANLITAVQVDAGTINAEVLNAKAAHFAQLIIDELRSAGGAYLLSAADCTIDYVEKLNSSKNVITTGTTAYYRCYYKANDNERAIAQKFVVGDQVMHTTYDAADVVDYSSDNGYYWMAVHEVSSEPVLKTLQDGEIYPCHWLDLDANNKSSLSNTIPQVGDDAVLLGHQVASGATPTEEEKARQYAIYITAYSNSFDTEVQPPAIVFYQNINSFDLSAANGKKPNYWGRDKVVVTGQLFYTSSGSGTGTDVSTLVGADNYSFWLDRGYQQYSGSGDLTYKVKMSKNGVNQSVTEVGSRLSLSSTSGCTLVSLSSHGDLIITPTASSGNAVINCYTDTAKMQLWGQLTASFSKVDVPEVETNDQYVFSIAQDTKTITARLSGETTTYNVSYLDYTINLTINGEKVAAGSVNSYLSIPNGSGTNCTASLQSNGVVRLSGFSTSVLAGGSATINCYTSPTTHDNTTLWGVLTLKYNVEWSSYAMSVVDGKLKSYATNTTVDALGNRLDTAESNITQNSDDISAQARRITTNETNITNLQIQADGISANVASQKYNSNLFGFTDGLSFTDSCVPFIQAYGVEIVGNSVGSITGFGGKSVDGVTISFDARTLSGTTSLSIRVNGTVVETISGVSTTWQRKTITVDDITTLNSISASYSTSGIVTVALRNIKVESGGVATAFCISDNDGRLLQNTNMFTTTVNYDGEPIANLISDYGESLDKTGAEGHGTVMVFHRSSNSSQPWLFYAWTNPLKAFTSGKVYTLSFWAKTGTLPSEVSFVRLQMGLWNTDIGTWRAYNPNGTYFNLNEGVSNIGQFPCEITPTWKRYYVRFYINTSTTAEFVARINEEQVPFGSNSDVYVYVADVRFEEGYIADDSDPMSVSGAQTRSESKMTLTSQEYSVEVRNDLKKAGMTITVDGVQFTGSKIGFAGTNGVNYISLGIDNDGIPYFIFYDPQGTPRYNLGYKNGLEKIINESQSASFELAFKYYIQGTRAQVYSSAEAIYNSATSSTTPNNAYVFHAGYMIDSQGDKVYQPTEGQSYDGLYYNNNTMSNYLPASGNTKMAEGTTTHYASKGTFSSSNTVHGYIYKITNGTLVSKEAYSIQKRVDDSGTYYYWNGVDDGGEDIGD